jgi:hypothetical protein
MVLTQEVWVASEYLLLNRLPGYAAGRATVHTGLDQCPSKCVCRKYPLPKYFLFLKVNPSGTITLTEGQSVLELLIRS